MKPFPCSVTVFVLICALLGSSTAEDANDADDDFFSRLFNSFFGDESVEADSDNDDTNSTGTTSSLFNLTEVFDLGNTSMAGNDTEGSITSPPEVSMIRENSSLPNNTGTTSEKNGSVLTTPPTVQDVFTGENPQQMPSVTTPTSNEDDSFGDFFRKLFEGAESVDDNSADQKAVDGTPSSPSSTLCKSDPDIRDYCIVSESLSKFLSYNYSFDHLESTIFNCDVLSRLQTECRRGEWCLPNDIVYGFMQLSDEFMNGPLCSSGLSSCLQIVNADMKNCSVGKRIYSTDAALELLCELGRQTGLTYECFGRVMAMLHVNLADILRNDMVPDDGNFPIQCESQKGLQIKSFLCLKNLCTAEEAVLMRFQPWWWFMNNVDAFKKSCSYTDVCNTNTGRTTESPITTMEPETTTISPEEVNKAEENIEDEGHIVIRPIKTSREKIINYFNTKRSNDRTRMLVGISAAVLVASFGLTMLVCALWKRINRHQKRYHPGYSKLSSEEVQPLYQ